MANEIKEYVEMGFLKVYTKRSETKIYILPWHVCVWVIKQKDIPKANRPELVDLTKYGYGFEALSAICGADRYDSKEGEVECYIAGFPPDDRNTVRNFIAERRDKRLPITMAVVRNFIEAKKIGKTPT